MLTIAIVYVYTHAPPICMLYHFPCKLLYTCTYSIFILVCAYVSFVSILVVNQLLYSNVR